jgi:hypothetical protein
MEVRVSTIRYIVFQLFRLQHFRSNVSVQETREVPAVTAVPLSCTHKAGLAIFGTRIIFIL